MATTDMVTPEPSPVFPVLPDPPSTPPATPLARNTTRLPPQTSHTSPMYKRMGFAMLAQSAPLEFIEPIGQGHHFNFTRPQPRDQSSRHTTPSAPDSVSTPRHTEPESDSDDESEPEIQKPIRRVEKAEFELEELDSDDSDYSTSDVLKPYQYEDASSEAGNDKIEETESVFIGKFSELRCAEGALDAEEQERAYRRKKKRWSAGIFKRSHSQSVGSDSDDGEQLDAHDVGSSARRLRRRVRGPEDRRGSLIFEDNGYSADIRRVMEVQEEELEGGDGDDGMMGMFGYGKGPPSIPSDDGFTLDELPFWVVEGEMDIEQVESV